METSTALATVSTEPPGDEVTLNMETITDALRGGAKLHAFLSGGGLRVVRVEKGDKLLGYGEHPYVGTSLMHLAEDLRAGSRPYSETYGSEGCYTSYLTGSSKPDSPLDAWVRKGSTFDAFVDGDEIVFELHGYEHQEIPEDIKQRVRLTKETVTFEARGYTFEVGPYTFPGNGEPGVIMKTIKHVEGRPRHRDTFYRVVKTGRAKTLMGAIDAAFEAPSVENFNED